MTDFSDCEISAAPCLPAEAWQIPLLGFASAETHHTRQLDGVAESRCPADAAFVAGGLRF